MKKFPESLDIIWNSSINAANNTVEYFTGKLDQQFGKGFCKKHPEILASMVQSALTTYSASIIAAAIQDSKGQK